MIWLFGLALVVAVGVGVWLGLPGKYDQSLDEINERLAETGKDHKTAKRTMTFINLMKKEERGSKRRRRPGRTPFKTD